MIVVVRATLLTFRKAKRGEVPIGDCSTLLENSPLSKVMGMWRYWIHWRSGTAQLLPRLIAGRNRGPLFLCSSPTARSPAKTPEPDR